MKKFKNICTIALILLVLIAITTCIVLYWTNPSFLKRSIEYSKEILNHPLPIVGISVGTGALLVWEIFKNTSFGKNGIAKMKEQCDFAVKKTEELQDKAQECYKQTEQFKSDTIAVLSDFSKEYDKLSEQLIKVCETSPNAKIQALGREFKEQIDGVKAELTEKVEKIGEEYEVNKDKTLEEVQEQLKKLQEQFNKVVEEYESEQ